MAALNGLTTAKPLKTQINGLILRGLVNLPVSNPGRLQSLRIKCWFGISGLKSHFLHLSLQLLH
jgi:hypothetical protein